jgi:hypothetical protein
VPCRAALLRRWDLHCPAAASARDRLEAQVRGARAHRCDHNKDGDHCGCDEQEDAGRPVIPSPVIGWFNRKIFEKTGDEQKAQGWSPGPSPMHEALCRPSGTTLDIVHAERRAADHSANIGSKGPAREG